MGKNNLSEQTMVEMFSQEPVDIWVNSFGGSRSNYIRDALKDTYKTLNKVIDQTGCHYIRPLDVNVDKGIFCYTEDVGIALSSQLTRKLRFNFQKLVEGEHNVPFSFESWLDNIDKQIDHWTTDLRFPTLVLNTDKIEDHRQAFEATFGVKLGAFRERKTKSLHKDLEPHVERIQQINEKLVSLPDFELRHPTNTP